jgi:hypothetical protein
MNPIDRSNSDAISMVTPETNVSPARESLAEYKRRLRAVEDLIGRVEGRIDGLERSGRMDGAQYRRIIASTAALTDRVIRASVIAKGELEAESDGARPMTGFEIEAYREPQRKKSTTELVLSLVAAGGFAGLVAAGKHWIPAVWGTVSGMAAAGATWFLQRPRLWRRR